MLHYFQITHLPKKLLGSGFSTPYTPFCLICTISSELTCISHVHPFEWARVDIRWITVDGFDTPWIPRSFFYVGIIFIIFDTICKQHMYCICSPWYMLFKKSDNMLICFLQYALTHVITRHDIQVDSVRWDSMVGYVSTASSRRDSLS